MTTLAERNALWLQAYYDEGHTELPEPLRFDNLPDTYSVEQDYICGQRAGAWIASAAVVRLILIAALVFAYMVLR